MAVLALGAALLAFVHGNRYLFSVWLFLAGASFGLSNGAAGVFVTQAVGSNQTGIVNAFNSLARLIIGGVGAQIAAAIVTSQAIGHSHTPHESAFVIAFGLCALATVLGTVMVLGVPVDKASRSL